jgi:hypothetical protein
MTTAKVDLTVLVQFVLVLIGIGRNIESNLQLSFEHIKAVEVKLSSQPNVVEYPNLVELLEKHQPNGATHPLPKWIRHGRSANNGIITLTKGYLEEIRGCRELAASRLLGNKETDQERRYPGLHWAKNPSSLSLP